MTTSIHRVLFKNAARIRSLLIGSAFLSLIMAIVIITQMYLLSIVIAGVFTGAETTMSFRNTLILLAGLIVLRALLAWVREVNAQSGAIRIKSDIRERLFSHILRLGPVYTGKERTGELVSTAVEGVEKLDEYYTRYIPSAIAVLIIPVIIVLFALYIDPLSGLVLLITGPLIPLLMWLIGTYAENVTRRQWKAMSRMSAHFLDTLQGLTTLKMFGRSKEAADTVEKVSDRFRKVTMRVLKVAFLSGMVLELAASISIAIVAVQIGIRLIEGLIPFQLGLFVLLLAPEYYLPFRTFGAHHHAGMEGTAAAERIFEVIETVPNIRTSETGITAPGDSIEIVLQGMTFSYPGSGQPALKDVSVTIPPDSLTAVVGHSGSGKSTLANILLKFLEEYTGNVTVNGIPLDTIDYKSWHTMVAFVSQRPYFFTGTILENIKLARPGAGPDDVLAAAEAAGAHDFVKRFPQGYGTMLTENAVRLSGGEKQRLALARAFLKDAPLLIMDEPTTGLDPESEEKIMAATARLVTGRTSVVIAHRLNTVYRADRIVVLDNSTVAEYGTHRELLEKRGLYAGFVEAYTG